MGLHGMPGIGGSLGECGVCGRTFAKELMLDQPVRTISIDGINDDLCLHDRCFDKLQEIKGTGWETLPDGPLRVAYAKAAAEQFSNGRGGAK